MICDHCHHRFTCEEIPDKNGRCSDYLKDGEIVFDDEIKFNPSDTVEYDYDHFKGLSKRGSSESCNTNSS